MRLRDERGVTFGPVVGIVVIILAIVGFFALCTGDDDADTLGSIELVSHEYGGCDPSWDDCSGDSYENDWGGSDRNRNRGRDRGAFSPGPFRDSPVDAFNNVCMPGATCSYDGQRDERGQEGEPS